MRFLKVMVILLPVLSATEIFSSREQMEKLVETEKNLFKVLDDYIKHLDERTAQIRLYHDEFAKAIENSENGIESYLDNPVRAFLLARRLIVSWKEVETLMSSDIGKSIAREIMAKRFFRNIHVPSPENLREAADEVKKLQVTYHLNATEMAWGGPFGIPLNSGDCFELGRQFYEAKEYNHAEDWLEEAYRRSDDGRSKKAIIIEYIAAVAYLKGSIRRALELSKYLLEVDPNNANAPGNIKYYESKLVEINRNKEKAIRGREIDILDWDDRDIADLVGRLCARTVVRKPRAMATLRCRYVNDKPFLKLARLQEEELMLHPRIVQFHDVVSSGDIASLFNLVHAGPKDVNNKIFQGRTNLYPDLFNPRLQIIERRMADITGLNLTYADLALIQHFALGGYANTHSLFTKPDAIDVSFRGPVISSLHVFLNDAVGGELVFPGVKLVVPAKRGSAVFWHVTQLHGPEETLTRHAVCPVLENDEWVLTKIFRAFGNEFKQPCALKRQPYH